MAESPDINLNSSMIISVITEHLSDNLGDAIITDTESYLIQRLFPTVEVRKYDLSCRKRRPLYTDEWSRSGIRIRLGRVLGIAHMFRNVTSALYTGSAVRRHFRQACTGSDLVLIGGGQLFLDNRLQFPSMLFAIARELQKNPGLPYIIFGVGVAKKWTHVGRLLVLPLVANSTAISVRDSESKSRLLALFPRATSIGTHADSALFAKETYSLPAKEPAINKVVGLGIMAVPALKAAYLNVTKLNEDDLISFWRSLAQSLLAKGNIVCIFTNGNKRDAWLAEKVHDVIRTTSIGTPRLELRRPASPKELASCINHLDCVVAFRLHAIIVGTSLGKSIVPLYWDDKTNGFLRIIGAEGSAIEFDPEDIAPILELVERDGITYSNESIEKEKGRIINSLSHAILDTKERLP